MAGLSSVDDGGRAGAALQLVARRPRPRPNASSMRRPLPTRRRPDTIPLSRSPSRGYACLMEHHALSMSAIPRCNATLLTARVTDPGCASLEESLPETIQFPYPRPRSSATRLFPQTKSHPATIVSKQLPRPSYDERQLFENNPPRLSTIGGRLQKHFTLPTPPPRWRCSGNEGCPRMRRPSIPGLRKMSRNCVSVGTSSQPCDSISMRQRRLPGDGLGVTHALAFPLSRFLVRLC